MARSLYALLLVLVLSAAALADPPGGSVRLGGWTAPERGRSGVDLGARIELTPRIGLDALLAGSDGEGGRAEQAWARLDLGDVRLAGGVTGRDGGVHLGWAPQGRFQLASRVALEAGLDASLGAGFLGGDRRARTGRHRDLWPHPVDLWAGGLAAQLELQVRPVDALLLAAGARGAVTAVAAPPVEGQPPEALRSLARELDLGLLGALSQAELGVWGRVEWEAWRGVVGGAPLALRLGYLESWEQLRLDPLHSLLQALDDDLGLGPVPWRVTRALELGLDWGGEARGLSLSLDVRRVEGSTTLETFSDRNGWSIGASLAGRWDRLLLVGSLRWALSPADVEPLVGELARVQASARLGVLLVDEPGLALRVEAGVEVGLGDELGLVREELAWVGGLALDFGAPSRPPIDPRRDPFARATRAAASLPLPTSTREQAPLDLSQLRSMNVEQLEALLERVEPADLARALGVELPTPDAVETWVARHPGLVARIEQTYPGAGALLDKVLVRLRSPRPPASPRGPAALVLGHGLHGPSLALLSAGQGGSALEAVTVRLQSPSELLARSEVDGLVVSQHPGFSAWTTQTELEKWTILRPGSKAPWLQGRSAWSRLMHTFLTGR